MPLLTTNRDVDLKEMLFSFLKTKAKSYSLGGNKDNLAGVKNVLSFLDENAMYPEFHSISSGVNKAECTVGGKKYLLFCSNNYLSLSEDPEVVNAGKKAVEKYGMGPGGSRVINGNVDIVEQLEVAIAALTGHEDCLTFPTGYMANVGVIKAIMDPLFFDMPYKTEDGIIFSDELNHGSIVDGCRLTKAKKVVFKHDSLEDLVSKLEEYKGYANKFIITEGVFSLDGEIIDLPKYIEIARTYGAKLMVDDAHGIGVIGKNGGGVVDYHDCMGEPDVLMGCMDKAFGGTGGFLCGKKELIRYLRIACRSSILSSAIPAGMAGAMLESVKKIKQMETVRVEIADKAKYVREKLHSLGFRVISRDPIPVVALYVGNDQKGMQFARLLWEEGIFSPIIRWPAVPENESRFRILMMKSHTAEHLGRLVEACEKVGKKLKLI